MTPAEAAGRPVGLLHVATVSRTVRQFLLPFAAHFREKGWRVEVAAAGVTADPDLRDAFDGLHELPLSRSIRDLAGMVRGEQALARLVAGQVDIVHVHTPIAGFLTRAAVRRMPPSARPAVAYTAHGFHFYRGGPPISNAVFLTAERVAGRWTDRLIVINDEDEEAARRHRIVRRSRLVRMPGIGIDTGWYSRSRVTDDERMRAMGEHGFSGDAPLFVVIGELSPNKRPADVVAALASMRHTDARLLLLGDGAGRASLEAQVERLGLGERVRIAGFVRDVRPAVSAAAAVVLASGREGLPRSLMEALSLEVPVVASAARGNVEIVDGDGLTVAIGDVAGLARAMDLVLDHPREASAMATRGRARMVAQYGLSIVMGLHDDLYAQMLAERSVRLA